MQDLLPFAAPAEQKYLKAVEKHGSQYKAAEALGVNVRTIQRALKNVRDKAAKQGYSPDHDMTRPVPDGFLAKGVSTLYNADGELTAQWVKSSIDLDRQRQMIQEYATTLSESLPRESKIKPPKLSNTELLNLYPITDYHLGMLAHEDETGAAWDLEIAENLLVDWFKMAIQASPKAYHGVFAQLGDFLHFDGLLAVTPSHGHVLDASARFHEVVRSAIRCLRRILRMLLQVHQKVTFIMAEGNHDLASSLIFRELLAAVYEDEPRIEIITRPDPYYCVEHGKTSLFFHHGHLKKKGSLDSVFTGKFRDVFGRTEYSYAHTGHLHHVDIKETTLMIVEQHRTLAAPDAYASRGGWLSGRDAKVITYSSQYGEVARNTLSAYMVQQLRSA